jgi:DNA polymerase III delta prime subunit
MQINEISKNKSDNEKLSHAYLFISQKMESAQKEIDNLINSVGCLKSDISIIKPSEESGKAGEIPVASIRAFIHELSLSSHGGNRIGIIYQADRLNTSSSNILLKILEEPAKNVIIILTAKSSDVIATIKSRCRVVRINDSKETKSITYSYKDFIDSSLAKSFKMLEGIVKDNQVDVLLTDWTQQLEEKLLTEYDIKSAMILEKIISIRKKIAGNANPRLAVENLILFMKKGYER